MSDGGRRRHSRAPAPAPAQQQHQHQHQHQHLCLYLCLYLRPHQHSINNAQRCAPCKVVVAQNCREGQARNHARTGTTSSWAHRSSSHPPLGRGRRSPPPRLERLDLFLRLRRVSRRHPLRAGAATRTPSQSSMPTTTPVTVCRTYRDDRTTLQCPPLCQSSRRMK